MQASVRLLLLTGLAMAGGCSGRGRDPQQQGRTYTTWFYQRDFAPLWARFSPEMKQTFPSPAALASFAGRTVDGLGAEQGAPQEELSRQDSLTVYSRLATFERSTHRMLLQWTLTRDGTVTGFMLRPATDSLPPG
jgi:hypothetical protein